MSDYQEDKDGQAWRPGSRRESVSEVIDGRVVGEVGQGLRIPAHVAYALFAISWMTGGLALLIAVIICYVKRGDARGTFYASHFAWLIRTFWVALIAGAIGVATLHIGIGFVILGVLTIWMVYRIVKGWLYLFDGKVLR